MKKISFILLLVLCGYSKAFSKELPLVKVKPNPNLNPNVKVNDNPKLSSPSKAELFWSSEDEKKFKEINQDSEKFSELKRKRDAWYSALALLSDEKLQPQITFQVNESNNYTFTLPESGVVYEVNYDNPDNTPQAIKITKELRIPDKLDPDGNDLPRVKPAVDKNTHNHSK